MSTTKSPATTPPPGSLPKTTEVKLVSHSNLFYWWPVWVLAFFMAAWTYVENHRLVIVPSGGSVSKVDDGYLLKFPPGAHTPVLDNAVEFTKANRAGEELQVFRPRVSQQASLGAIFVIGLLLTIVITNVPLRGLWSFVAIILIVLLALIISLLKAWDQIFEAVGELKIHINLAGYLFIGVAVFVLWALATFVFDRRSYIIFTPGQIRVCEHIGASVQTYNTMGVGLEKQRDDLFRHYILGFGSGDLIVRTSGPDRHEIKMPNVLGIGWRLKTVEDMLLTVTTT
jgi:hypothetical protein